MTTPALVWYEKYSSISQAEAKSSLTVESLEAVEVLSDLNEPGLPKRLKIPNLDIDATIEYVGVNEDGEMDTPQNIADVAWFKLGSIPGEIGSAVIGGHFNGENGEEGVFANLNQLQASDIVFIEDEKGLLLRFIVREIELFEPGYAEEVFSKSDKPYLNLITCDGVWNEEDNTYSQRLVVFAELY